MQRHVIFVHLKPMVVPRLLMPTVADLGFDRQEETSLIFWPIFFENYVKTKKIKSSGCGASLAFLSNPPLVVTRFQSIFCIANKNHVNLFGTPSFCSRRWMFCRIALSEWTLPIPAWRSSPPHPSGFPQHCIVG